MNLFYNSKTPDCSKKEIKRKAGNMRFQKVNTALEYILDKMGIGGIAKVVSNQARD